MLSGIRSERHLPTPAPYLLPLSLFRCGPSCSPLSVSSWILGAQSPRPALCCLSHLLLFGLVQAQLPPGLRVGPLGSQAQALLLLHLVTLPGDLAPSEASPNSFPCLCPPPPQAASWEPKPVLFIRSPGFPLSSSRFVAVPLLTQCGQWHREGAMGSVEQ